MGTFTKNRVVLVVYNKLVRDKIPEIIKNSGQTPVYRKITGDELEAAAKQKLREEVEEFLASDMDIEEMADIFEVIGLLMDINGWTYDQIGQVQLDKEKRRGSFHNRILLERTEEKYNSLQQLKTFEMLEDNWNSYGAVPISKENIETAEYMLKHLPDIFEAFPLANGGIQIENENKEQYIEIVVEDSLTVYSEPEEIEHKPENMQQAIDIVDELLGGRKNVNKRFKK